LKKKYASLKSVSNAAEYVEKIILEHKLLLNIYAFDKSLQPYPPMRCLTPDEKVYNFENVNATANSIIVNLPEPVKSGCKKYNLPTTVYIISVSHCSDNNLNKSLYYTKDVNTWFSSRKKLILCEMSLVTMLGRAELCSELCGY